jgi:hypothetical protein
MKPHITALALLFCLLGQGLSAKKTELYSSRYFIFQSSQPLNAHLFLYNKAIGCKFGKVNNDSLAFYALKDKWSSFSATDKQALNTMIRFYKDSLLSKDLLFDSLMRNFEDYLSAENSGRQKLKNSWQLSTLEVLRSFQPYFAKLYWPAIDSANKTWLNTHKASITAMESSVVPELERIYKMKLPDAKVRIDLACYATWAGAFSYRDGYCHVILSSQHKGNQGDLATEVVFHETSHFIVDKLMEQIAVAARTKNVKKELSLWHNVIFYTTGFIMEKEYKLKWQKFEPYYVQMKFQEKFPEFKNSVDACKLYWDPYIKGESGFDAAVNGMVTYVVEKQ